MADLLTLVREYDLPPKWDGLLVVEWTAWEPQPDVFICPPPRKRPCCPSCGSPNERVYARGLVALWPGLTQAEWVREEKVRARLPLDARVKRPTLARWRLYAYRCQDCKHDQVWDTEADKWWDLDHTDYGPEGSNAP